MSETMFRKEALDARHRVDRLQSTMHVTSGLTRAALAALVLMTGTAVAWSAFVEVPVQVDGKGVFVDTSGELLKPARAVMEGAVDAILVNEGDHVTEGQIVARLRLPERLTALQKTERDLVAARERYRQTEALQTLERENQARSLAERRKALSERIANLERRLEWQRDLERDQAQLAERGISTRNKLLEVRVAVQAAAEQLAAARNEMLTLSIEPDTAESRMEREMLALKSQIEQLVSEITAIRAEIERGSVVRSAATGTVAEISAERHGQVTAGQPVLSVIPENFAGRLEAITYVSMSDGKLVKIGDAVLLKPSSLPVREQGRVRGTVMEISEAPITDRALTRVLGNAALVQQVAGSGAPFAVRVALHRDPRTPSAYAWTSGTGPDMRLTPGTPVSSVITVENETLLSLAMPALRRVLGATD